MYFLSASAEDLHCRITAEYRLLLLYQKINQRSNADNGTQTAALCEYAGNHSGKKSRYKSVVGILRTGVVTVVVVVEIASVAVITVASVAVVTVAVVVIVIVVVVVVP